MPRISVILPTRDRPPLLSRAVASVLAQTERDYELIVVDNNRAEPAVMARHRGEPWLSDPRVRVVSASNAATAGASRNVGLDAATGEWIAYLDDDDAYRPTKLQRQLELAMRTGAPSVLCGAAYRLSGRTRCVQSDAELWTGDALLLCARWGTPFLFHRRTLLRFDPTLAVAEDAELAHRLCREFGVTSVPVVPDPLVDVYPQPGPRVNVTVAPQRRAAGAILRTVGLGASRQARRRFTLKTLLTIAKLERRTGRCVSLGIRLLLESRGADWRDVANAIVVSGGVLRGRWVS